jgi:diphthamide synthase (EF-2-diphthine--ammonia ligase)
MKPKSFFCGWSGGKDSCYALMKAQEQGFAPTVLLNMLNENDVISLSHAIPDQFWKNRLRNYNENNFFK